MRIQLIFPPFVPGATYPPLGLAYIGAVLEKDGHQVNILDASALRLSWSDTLRKIKSFKPDIIGITTITTFFDKVKKLSYLIKDETPDVPLLVGGPHATCLPKETLRETKADIAVIGEGERTIVELVNAIQKNAQLKFIKGIAFRMGNGIFVTESRELIEDLDSLPFPARHLLHMNVYQRGITSAIASRGCPFNCLFCSVRTIWGRSYRIRSPENVVSELIEIYEKFKIRRIFFQDDEFTLNKKWVLRFCDELGKVKVDFKWVCLSRVDTVDKEILLKMRKAGCYRINFGVESGNDAILTTIRKEGFNWSDYSCIRFSEKDGHRNRSLLYDR